MGFGLAYNQGDKWSVEVDYLRGNWTGSNFDQVRGFRNNGVYAFTTGTMQSVKAGFEITPNRNDIRYFLRRCTYRVGGYFDQSYYQVDGKNILSAGITLGMTVPVFQGYNGITFAIDLGQRGFGTGFVKENYLGFHVGFNIFDIWCSRHENMRRARADGSEGTGEQDAGFHAGRLRHAPVHDHH